MSFFTDYRSHYFAGWLYGLGLRLARASAKEYLIIQLDHWAWRREWKQNLKAKHPNATLSEKQLREAMAWGAGARDAAEVIEPYPSPPYEAGAKWVA